MPPAHQQERRQQLGSHHHGQRSGLLQ